MNRDDLCIYRKLLSWFLGISEFGVTPYARENLQHCWEAFTRERLALWENADVVYHKFIMYRFWRILSTFNWCGYWWGVSPGFLTIVSF